jgi:hypothetical protein
MEEQGQGILALFPVSVSLCPQTPMLICNPLDWPDPRQGFFVLFVRQFNDSLDSFRVPIGFPHRAS